MTTTTQPRPLKESANLDLLRSFAVLLVLFDHVLTWFGIRQIGFISSFDMGMLGVLLFFVHTTLVLMFSLERLRSRQGERRLFWVFMLRRCFRIYPLSMLAVLVIFAFKLPFSYLQPFHMGYTEVGFRGLAANLLLIQNLSYTHGVLGPLWSLPLEMQMYLLLPFLFAFAGRVRSIWPLLGLWMLGVGAAFGYVFISSRLNLAYFVPNFVPGVIAYKLSSRLKPRLPFVLWPCVLIGLTGLYMLTGRFEHGWVICLLTGVAIPCFREMQQPWLRRASHLVAKYSYGIYLGHFASIWLAFVVLAGASAVVQWSMLVLSLLVIPVALFHAVESPLIAVGVRLGERLAARPATLATAAGAAAP